MIPNGPSSRHSPLHRTATLSRGGFGVFVIAACILPMVVCGTANASSASPSAVFRAAASVQGPITTGHIVEPLAPVGADLAGYGYMEQEFFASGNASSFRTTSAPSNGRWSIVPDSSAFYRTRFIVRRPTNPKHFDGTVVVEWFNVSGGESSPDWSYLTPELLREGTVYVGVSVQALGVSGGTPIMGTPVATAGGIVAAEPSRYGSLVHPGDQYALDIFDQVGRALRAAKDKSVFGNLHPKRFLALGESQSAFYLTTFADALEPRTHTYDGFFIHSRGGNGMPIPGATNSSQTGGGQRIRTDLSVPVFMFETQSDPTVLGFADAQQPDTTRIRTWEVAGTSHADLYLVGTSVAQLLGCGADINSGPQHWVAQAAFAALNRWAIHRTPPPTAPLFQYSSMNPVTYALDANGNVLGGVRTPAVDVPISTLSGSPPPGAGMLCALFGSTAPFSAEKLGALYQSSAGFLSAFTASLDKAIKAGFLLPTDRSALLAQAQQVTVP